MSRPHLKISVPKPCSESWASMAPETNGRFCESCATTVLDFSQFSDKELLDYFVSRSGKMCGRFSATQLNRAIYAETLPKQSFIPRLVAVAALFLGISSQTQAQSLNTHPVPSSYTETEEKPVNQKIVAKTPEKVDGKDSLVISGRVIDTEEKVGLPGVTVLIKDTKLWVSTDLDGNFKITIPDSVQINEIVLVVRYIGYMPTELKIDTEALSKGDVINMEINAEP